MRGYRKDPERIEVRVLQRHVRLSGARVLEIGCGDGRLTRRILGSTRSVLGVDPNGTAIARARQLTAGAKATFQIATADDLSVPDHSFDVALLSWSL